MRIIFSIFAILTCLSSCKKDMRLFEKDPKTFLTEYGNQNLENEVVIKTVGGDITVKLYDKTPLHRANFIRLVKSNWSAYSPPP